MINVYGTKSSLQNFRKDENFNPNPSEKMSVSFEKKIIFEFVKTLFQNSSLINRLTNLIILFFLKLKLVLEVT